ncbi:MAG: type II toxin-antitoxin system HicA family toxin [Terracidiphilus sp.]|jgi:predicted RNA binding protein YcfA (HicA-like mRNA interferase family)
MGGIVTRKKAVTQYKHPVKPGRATVPVHGGKDLSKSDVQSILKQAGLK